MKHVKNITKIHKGFKHNSLDMLFLLHINKSQTDKLILINLIRITVAVRIIYW